MKFFSKIPSWLRNKYFIAAAVFFVVILFLDKNDLFTQMDRSKELKGLEQSKAYYTTEIATERKELEGLKNDPAVLEKYAREKYLMKKENEEIFLIPEAPENTKK
jgi:cell division protein FtsB